MKSNMSQVDRTIRVILAAGLAALVFTNVLAGGWAILALIVAGIFIATSIVKFCPLYLPFKISTKTK